MWMCLQASKQEDSVPQVLIYSFIELYEDKSACFKAA
jgi:hypothetical protein